MIRTRAFYTYNTLLIFSIRLRKLTGIRQGEFPFIYLGCPIFYGRKRCSYFVDIIKKVTRRISSWQNKFIFFGGKIILVNHVLQSLPIYLLSALSPPKGVIRKLHQAFSNFFWGNTGLEKKKHWVSWEAMCYPREEGGLGLGLYLMLIKL